jgi:uncharacterized membrane protein YedE/YeeE
MCCEPVYPAFVMFWGLVVRFWLYDVLYCIVLVLQNTMFMSVCLKRVVSFLILALRYVKTAHFFVFVGSSVFGFGWGFLGICAFSCYGFDGEVVAYSYGFYFLPLCFLSFGY